MKKKVEVKIDYALLKKIADYYEFPVAMFLMPTKDFPPKGTRRERVGTRMFELLHILEKAVEDLNDKTPV